MKKLLFSIDDDDDSIFYQIYRKAKYKHTKYSSNRIKDRSCSLPIIHPTGEYAKKVREMSSPLFVTLYTLSIYPFAHKQLIRHREFPCTFRLYFIMLVWFSGLKKMFLPIFFFNLFLLSFYIFLSLLFLFSSFTFLTLKLHSSKHDWLEIDGWNLNKALLADGQTYLSKDKQCHISPAP